MDRVLADVLAEDLDVVFCGTAAGRRSAERQAYYAGRGNRFWSVIHLCGLTPSQLQPEQYEDLIAHRIGLTDLAKHTAGLDSTLRRDDFDVAHAVARLKPLRPRVVAFNGKKAANVWLGARINASYGRHDDPHAVAQHLYVLPSTSGAARAYWDVRPWRDLAGMVGRSGEV